MDRAALMDAYIRARWAASLADGRPIDFPHWRVVWGGLSDEQLREGAR